MWQGPIHGVDSKQGFYSYQGIYSKQGVSITGGLHLCADCTHAAILGLQPLAAPLHRHPAAARSASLKER